MLKQLRKNQSGVVLVTVLVITMVMMILAISIVSLNVSEVITTEDLTDSLVAEELAKMYYWRRYYNDTIGNEFSETVGGKTFNIYIYTSTPTIPTNVTINVVY